MPTTLEAPKYVPLDQLVRGKGEHECHPLSTLRTNSVDDLARFSHQHPSTIIADFSHLPVPDSSIDIAERVMQSSQHNFIETWLYNHLSGKRPITITEEDGEANPHIDFDSGVKHLERFRDQVIWINKELPPELQNKFDQIKAVVAANRIMHAVVKRESEGVTKFLAMGAGIGALEYVVQHRFGLSPYVYALASTVDNGFAMLGEVGKLRKQGFLLEQAVDAMKVPVGVLGASIVTSFAVHDRFEAGEETLAGALYGAESGICVTPSIFGAINTMRPDYLELVREGKVDDPVLENLLAKENPNVWDRLRTFLISSRRALGQDLIYPHHIGLYAGAGLGIVLSTILASIPVSETRVLLQHPLIVGPLGIADSAGGAVAGLLIDWAYEQKLKRDLHRLSVN